VKRSFALLALVTVLGAAAPDQGARLPVPPIPPANPPGDVAAPTPDADARAPVRSASTGPWVSVENFRAQQYDPSQGFAPGSRFQTTEERKPIQTPGISIRVPLQ
jgi:hypothetical protein